MKPKVTLQGSYWPADQPMNPCAIDIRWRNFARDGKSSRIQYPYWVLDYSMQAAAIRTRVGSLRAPWRERAARVAHLYPPGTPYWEWAIDPEVHIEGGFVLFTIDNDDMLIKRFMPRAAYACIADPDELIANILREGGGEPAVRSNPRSFWTTQAHLCSLLEVLSQAQPDGTENWLVRSPPPEESPGGLVAGVRAYLQAHMDEPVALSQVAHALHISLSSLSHRYKTLTGTSPLQTLIEMRIDYAKHLLRRGYKHEDIAAQCGFYNAPHFSRTFLLRTGQRPRHFARTFP